jgi:UDP-N-acetylmuramoyl-L-alanyl-D-glutamate--2,6-diaminopimelate ligase
MQELHSGLPRLKDLLNGLASLPARHDGPIAGLALDSRELMKGDAFIALAGAKQHGLAHAEQAVNNGACVVLFDPAGDGERLAAELLRNHCATDVPVIAVEKLGLKLGELATRFYGHPSRQMKIIGITGTNGKTSCSQFLSQVLDDCGIIGTLGWGQWGKLNKTANTTPDALAVQRILAELLKEKKQAVAMEVSSHGLEQGRVNGVEFTGAVFTNISRDHLDYHGTMDAYVQAKLELLKKPGLAFAVVNLDDEYSERIAAAVPPSVRKWSFSGKGKISASGESVNAENIRHKPGGIEFDLRWNGQLQRLKVPLYGDFNVENILAVLTVMLAMGIPLEQAAGKLAGIESVIGRMERFGAETDPMVFVDYAHTPDALEKVLSSLRKHCKQALWVVFGCGGNRDKGKRPQMGAIAERLADRVVITDDNPRYENGLDIVNDILAGCSPAAREGEIGDKEPVRSAKIQIIQNREQAIQTVVTSAAKDDCIVIAGKGHEQYQESNGVCVPFSDRQAVIDALSRRKA